MIGRFFEYRFVLGPTGAFFVLLAIAGFVFVVWMLIDASSRPVEDFRTPSTKTGWIVAMVVGALFGFGFLGLAVAIAYFVVVKMPGRPHAVTGTPAGPAVPASAPGQPPPTPGPPPPVNCRNCGAKLVAGARFCHSCGTPTVSTAP